MTDDITISAAVDDDWDLVYRSIAAAFNEDGDDEASAAERNSFEPARTLLARRDGELVGTAGVLTRRLCVPGGIIPAGHVTMISVAATARRRGLMTRFMHRQFADIHAAGEPIAVLWASEGRIYQRFGYGLAAWRASLTVDTREAELPAPAGGGRLRTASPGEVRDSLAKVYDEVYRRRPGWSERAPRHWAYRLADPSSGRYGASSLRAVIHEDLQGVDGYALFRTKASWGEAGPAGEVNVIELVSTTPEAYLALWRFLLTMDLTRTTSFFGAALDEPLLYLVNEPRRLGARLADALWVRIIDLPAALAARRYAAPVDVVIEVADPFIAANAGQWRLTGSPEAATCEPASGPADIACDVRALGAAYLGGTPLAALAGSGLVRELRPATLAGASVAFGWHRAPSAIEVF